MMTALRKNMKTVLWILVFAFIATIIFSWGMGGFSGPIEPGIVGKVDKVKITQEQYETALQNRIALERQNSDEPISDAKMRQIRNEVWNGLVNQVLLDKWRRKIGIVVTDDEVAFTVQNFPPPSVTKNPNFLDSTGAFDMNLYRQIIADPQNVNFVIALENNVRESLFQQKMVQRISSAGHVSEPEARDEFFRSNSTAVASYVLVAARNMEVDSSAVSEEELRRLYDERREEFRLPEERTVEYVLFPDEPSREDSLDALRLAEELMERIKGGEDFEELAKEYSDDNSAAKGGDLGWFGRGRMVPPFEEAAFGAAKGALVGPVLSRFGYHIIRVDDRRGKGEAEEVKARHILIKIKRSPETLDEMRTRAEGFRDEADENGFENAARVYNVVRDTLKNVRHGAFIPRFGRNQAASDFLFKRPKGSVSPIYSFRRGMVIFRVINVKPEGIQPFEEVRDRLLNDRLSELRMEKAKVEADRLYAQVKESGDLAAVAARNGFTMQTTKRPFKIGEFISGIGRDYHFSVAAFDLDVGEISPPIEGTKGYYLIRLDEKTVPDSSRWDDAAKDRIMRQLLQKRQQEVYDGWIASVRERADIKDFRYLYYSDF